MKHEPRPAKSFASRRADWQQQKRRLKYQVHTRFGKTITSPDDEYEQHEQRFLGLLQKLLDIRASLEHYRATALPLYSAACASLGADVWCVVSVETVGTGTDAEKFRHAMCAINETKEVKNHFFNADEVLAGALRFLAIHINAMESVQSQLADRKHVKLDADCYANKLQRLQCATRLHKPSASRLERNELKLTKARDALAAATRALYRVFAKYESERDTMLNGELEMVRQVMHSFYARNAAATDFSIRDESDRSALDAKTERVYQAMVAKERTPWLVLPNGATTAASGGGSTDSVLRGGIGDGNESDRRGDVAMGSGGGSNDHDDSRTSGVYGVDAAAATIAGSDALAITPHSVVDTDIHAVGTAGGNPSSLTGSETLSSPSAAMVAPLPSSPTLLHRPLTAATAAIASTDVALALDEHRAQKDARAAAAAADARQVEPLVSEDDLSEKLKTIQLTRPNVQPARHSRWRSSA